MAPPLPLTGSTVPAPPSTLNVTVPVGTPDPLAGVTTEVNVTAAPTLAGLGLPVSDDVVEIAVLVVPMENLDINALPLTGFVVWYAPVVVGKLDEAAFPVRYTLLLESSASP